MAQRFFHLQNSNREVGGFTFPTYGIIGGCPMGTYATEDPAEFARLDELLKEPRNAIEELTEADYALIQKKRLNTGFTAQPRPPTPVASHHVRPDAANASPVASNSPEIPVALAAPVPVAAPTTEPVAPLPAAEDAVKTGDVEPAQKAVPQKRAKTRKSEATPAQ